MVFSSLVFLFAFLPVILFLYFISPRMLKNTVLLLASLSFYAWGEPKYVFLMIFSVIMNYVFGLLVDKFRQRISFKKLFLILAIVGNLLVLGFFKYANFFIDNINLLLGTNLHLDPISLPIGISFFTFQAMSYIIDVYRRDAEVQRNFINLSLYISLFPQLIAGPIVRYNSVAKQIKNRIISMDKFSEGVKRFIEGLAKKVILANSFAVVADEVFATSANDLSVTAAWIGILAYTLQIYFDFSGYSDMAIGLGKIFGFDFLENFRFPYISTSVAEFWRRWHISLGGWFRDYVYIPLGGNRQGLLNTVRNLLIVWTITGFWHGASWTFVAWGFYYGVLIVIERFGFDAFLKRLWKPIQHFYLILVVMIGWVFFRADNFSYSFEFIQTMFMINDAQIVDNTTAYYLNDYWYMFILGIIFSMPVIPWLTRKLGENVIIIKIKYPLQTFAVPSIYIALLFFSMVLLVNSTYNPFIYFRF